MYFFAKALSFGTQNTKKALSKMIKNLAKKPFLSFYNRLSPFMLVTLDQMEPLPRQRYSVERIFLHPYYEFTPQADRYDVAVLKLNRKVRYDWHIRPVCLPPKDRDFDPGTVAMVAGWGATEPDSIKRPRELQAVDVKVVNSRTCEKWHRENGINLEIFDDMMCAGHELGGKDACQGDSGGPLMKREETGNWTLIGLVSAGYSCAKPGQPGIYHKLSKSSDWISYVKLHL